MDELLSVSILTSALKNRLNLTEKEAREKAEMLMDIFGFEDRIGDNHLPTITRKFFYVLQQERIITSEQDCFELPCKDGHAWFMYFWRLNTPNIAIFAVRKKIKTTREVCTNIYLMLDDKVWKSRSKQE